MKIDENRWPGGPTTPPRRPRPLVELTPEPLTREALPEETPEASWQEEVAW